MSYTLHDLRALLDSGNFHHATYRDLGTIWEGLWVYEQLDAARGFAPAGMFPKGSPDLSAAEDMVKHTGVSVGAYGQG